MARAEEYQNTRIGQANQHMLTGHLNKKGKSTGKLNDRYGPSEPFLLTILGCKTIFYLKLHLKLDLVQYKKAIIFCQMTSSKLQGRGAINYLRLKVVLALCMHFVLLIVIQFAILLASSCNWTHTMWGCIWMCVAKWPYLFSIMMAELVYMALFEIGI